MSDVFCIAMKKAERGHGQSGGEVSVELEESIYMGELAQLSRTYNLR